MTTPSTVADYAKLAREAIAAGDIAEATKLTEQAKALKALDTVALDTQPRLDFGAVEAPAASAQGMALKSWYKEQFGDDLDKDAETLMRDLYGKDVRALAYAKTVGFMRYLRTGRADEMAHRVVMTPGQVMKLIADGQDYASIKATQVESQDILGGLTARFA